MNTDELAVAIRDGKATVQYLQKFRCKRDRKMIGAEIVVDGRRAIYTPGGERQDTASVLASEAQQQRQHEYGIAQLAEPNERPQGLTEKLRSQVKHSRDKTAMRMTQISYTGRLKLSPAVVVTRRPARGEIPSESGGSTLTVAAPCPRCRTPYEIVAEPGRVIRIK